MFNSGSPSSSTSDETPPPPPVLEFTPLLAVDLGGPTPLPPPSTPTPHLPLAVVFPLPRCRPLPRVEGAEVPGGGGVSAGPATNAACRQGAQNA